MVLRSVAIADNEHIKMWKCLWNWVMSRGQKWNLEANARINLYYYEQSIKSKSSEGLEDKKIQEKSETSQRLSECDQNADKDMNSKSYSDEVLGGTEEHALAPRVKAILITVTKNLVDLHPCLRTLQNVIFDSNELGCMAEEISQQRSIHTAA